MREISQTTKTLTQGYKSWYQSLQQKENISTVHVDEVASKVAAFYEKIRGVVDWREEHLMRRVAIERILKRRMFLQKNGEDLASPFVFELIRGGYFPNDKIEETKIGLIKNLLNKYVFILNKSPSPPAEKAKIRLYNWLLSLAACETEEILDPPRRERALIEYMEELMKERVSVSPEISETEKNIQISIATQRALFKLDRSIISYHLLKKRYQNWLELPPSSLEEVAKNIYLIWDGIEKDLKHRLSEKFYRICERYDTPYLILGDILSANPLKSEEKIKEPEILEGLIREFYQKRARQLKSRIARAAFFSTISIFLTKMLLAFAIEIPYDKYVVNEFSYQTLGLNILIPPLLMFLLIFTIRPPKKSNLELVVMETMKIVYAGERQDTYLVKIPKKRGIMLNIIITLFYMAMFIFSFGFIWWGLTQLNFGILSIIIFLVFFTLICFAGVKIRERSKELLVETEKEGFLSFLMDSISLPYIRMGKWLSGQWAKYNIVVVLLVSLIDMPFTIFVEFLEQWRYFLKEKKEEIH